MRDEPIAFRLGARDNFKDGISYFKRGKNSKDGIFQRFLKWARQMRFSGLSDTRCRGHARCRRSALGHIIRVGDSQVRHSRLRLLYDLDDLPPLIDKDHIERKAHRCHSEGIPDLRGEDEQHAPTLGQERTLTALTPVCPWGPCQLDEKPSAEYLAGTQLDGRSMRVTAPMYGR